MHLKIGKSLVKLMGERGAICRQRTPLYTPYFFISFSDDGSEMNIIEEGSEKEKGQDALKGVERS